MKQEVSDRTYINAIEIVKKHGLRITNSRQAVLKCLCDSKKPLSPRKLTDLIAQRGFRVRSIDQATVYRILESFKKIELVHEIQATPGFILCHHVYCPNIINILAICSKCKHSRERHVPMEVATALKDFLFKQEGFTAQGHSIELTGVCSSCTAIES